MTFPQRKYVTKLYKWLFLNVFLAFGQYSVLINVIVFFTVPFRKMRIKRQKPTEFI